ncbi:hypothetical protein [Pseudonocardia xishanensis]|uniref:hypothetical protein n=1 Tax=Pseudonocardia xishanensis TaxID=630995 RepID=UPI0031EE69AE
MAAFADRLNRVFRAFPQTRGGAHLEAREWSNEQVSRAAEEVYGRSLIKRQHLRLLRSGERPRPSIETASAIARAFELLSRDEAHPGDASAIASYLTLDQDEVSAEDSANIADLRERLSRPDMESVIQEAMRASGVESIAFRARGLSPESLKAVLGIIEHSRTLEGLDDDRNHPDKGQP